MLDAAAADAEFVKTVHVPMVDLFEIDGGICEEWPAQFEQILQILRSWRDEGITANINCQMGKNRSGAAVLLWLCCECGWELDPAIQHLRSITALACGNPHLVAAMSQLLQSAATAPLNPAQDGGGWVCLSPPGTPRQGAAVTFDSGFSAGGVAEAANRLAELRTATEGGGGYATE
jgi:hypothetical protein